MRLPLFHHISIIKFHPIATYVMTMPAEQTISVLLPSSSSLMMFPLLTQRILSPFTLLSSAVVEFLAPSPAISLPATLKPLSGPNIVSPLTPVEKIVSVFLSSSSPLMTSSLLAPKISVPSILLSNTVVELFIPPATQSISLKPWLDPAVEFSVKDRNQRQSISVPAALPSLDLDPLDRPAN